MSDANPDIQKPDKRTLDNHRAAPDWAQLYQQHSRQVLATLIRLLGDFDQAEEAVHEAFTQAMQQWPRDGIPDNPVAWLVSTGRFKAIDQMRRDKRAREYSFRVQAENSQAQEFQSQDVDVSGFDTSGFDTSDFDTSGFGVSDIDAHHEQAAHNASDPTGFFEQDSITDDELRLIFTCCHPGLSEDAQLAMTLREMCRLTTEQVARGLLQQPTTIAQRIVRAKRKIRDAGIPYEVPDAAELPQRLGIVLKVIYLMYNEAYSSSIGNQVVNVDLSAEAIRLCGLLQQLLPNADVAALLALMLLQDARKKARQTADGQLLTLDRQDRRLWDKEQIAQGVHWLEWSLNWSRNNQAATGFYALQAAIAALHAQAEHYEHTDWPQICGLYDLLLQVAPSPVIALNRAVAIAMRDGPAAGLALIEDIAAQGELERYHLLHAARADFYRRLDRQQEAIAAYEQALALTTQEPEKQFLMNRLAELRGEG